MESFGHKMFISSQPVPLTGTGVLYPRVRDFLTISKLNIGQLNAYMFGGLKMVLVWIKMTHTNFFRKSDFEKFYYDHI